MQCHLLFCRNRSQQSSAFLVAFVLTGFSLFCNQLLFAQENANKNPTPFRLELVPEDAVSVTVCRIAELLEHPAAKPLKEFAFDDYFPESGLLGLNLTDIKSITLIQMQLNLRQKFNPRNNRKSPTFEDVIIVRSKQKLDRAQIKDKFCNSKFVETSYQKTSFLTNTSPDGVALMFLDEYTFVHSKKASFMKKIISHQQNHQSRFWFDRLQPVASALIFSGFNMPVVRAHSETNSDQNKERNFLFNPSRFTIWKYPESILHSINLQEKMTLELIFVQKDHSLEVKQELTKFVDFLQEIVARSNMQSTNQQDETVARLYKEILENAYVTRAGNQVKFSTSLSGQSSSQLSSRIVAAWTPAPLVARRPESKTNLKRIMLALSNYQDVYKHLPAAVVLGPDGKTPHSWRVEILPFLGQAELYRKYRMFEPWDSENNLKVAQSVVPEFRHPDSENPANASYFAVVGDGTAFGNEKGVSINDFTDSKSKTIVIVEAKRDILWTKPEDITYDGKKLPQFGGYLEGGYNVGMFDGTAQFISDMIEKDILKSLLMIADGEPKE
ncbi:hypothetical protein Mal35_18810 [Gimesia maris]|uniref:DUF1559 family PulG-like putative transporter n=1 Tax=Gimesia maris TaxID=122 RepID=UPI00118937CE|nr:DUF1559 domain-containing protein [Gimesia maris]QDT78432.1 hypothetical protein Mal35_18810 [Gimesia maris]